MQNSWISRLLPAATNTRPTEWSRAAIGVSLGTLLCVWVCSLFFGLPVAMHLIGPLGASAILLFAVSSGALAQPWSIVGGYLCATVVSLGVVHFFGRNLDSACLAVGLAMLIMCLLRCLHREKLYSNQLAQWRRELAEDGLPLCQTSWNLNRC